ncbi:MAG: hypothetical protein AAB368_12470 [bacterium]
MPAPGVLAAGLLAHIDVVVIVVIVLSLLPGVIEVLRSRRTRIR